MIEFEVDVPGKVDLSASDSIIEECCVSEGLRITMKDTLVKHPGSVHWHLKKGTERGTLEITLVAKERRIWFSVQAGRRGSWIEESINRLKPAIEKKLRAAGL